jgi:serine/threonine-protein kinase RIO1
MDYTNQTLLMEYVGSAEIPAKLLIDTDFDKETAELFWENILYIINLLLDQGMIHGGLSAYNILCREDQFYKSTFRKLLA